MITLQNDIFNGQHIKIKSLKIESPVGSLIIIIKASSLSKD